MSNSIFVEIEFISLIIFSFILPFSIYIYMMRRKAISRKLVLLFGVILITISGINVVLLQSLSEMAAKSSSLLDDKVFTSELSIALYLIPIIFAGIGVNILSHILISHLADAEKQFDREHR
ncbi:conserved membrane hypothetical protein [Candidatus Nitrotoga sp. BS]|uniref:hypothetical protein n=1 Tax=Candidatus Nitrotoga sp. BS TaxID=2890408 RepID=UPI001EF23BDD|nr:hypothetical protein [Candidatus Nitrotoga sp. BS]CAH1199700.1 conserved membrane hypothetical protein [Candidatus Nitrotoga sp. BS]